MFDAFYDPYSIGPNMHGRKSFVCTVEVQNFDDISQRFEIFLFEKILRRINDTDDLLSHWHRWVKLNGVTDTAESNSTISLTPQSLSMLELKQSSFTVRLNFGLHGITDNAKSKFELLSHISYLKILQHDNQETWWVSLAKKFDGGKISWYCPFNLSDHLSRIWSMYATYI